MGQVVRLIVPDHQHGYASDEREGDIDPKSEVSTCAWSDREASYQKSAYMNPGWTCPDGTA